MRCIFLVAKLILDQSKLIFCYDLSTKKAPPLQVTSNNERRSNKEREKGRKER